MEQLRDAGRALLDVLRGVPEIEAHDDKDNETLWHSPPEVPLLDLNYASSRELVAGIRALVEDSPRMMRDFDLYRPKDPGIIPSIVVPSFPLILTRMGPETMACVPGLTCTKNAIRDIFGRPPYSPDVYDIVESSPKIVSLMTNLALNPEQTLTYHWLVIRPKDYITLAGVGMIHNEDSRIALSNVLRK